MKIIAVFRTISENIVREMGNGGLRNIDPGILFCTEAPIPVRRLKQEVTPMPVNNLFPESILIFHQTEIIQNNIILFRELFPMDNGIQTNVWPMVKT